MVAFEYEQLNSNSLEIRLVKLSLTDVYTDDIQLDLIQISLDDKDHEPYVPLSYTWGMPCHGLSPDWDDPTRTTTVTLNGKNFKIRLNLESALRHIREVKKDGLPLWIDAICIDQANIPERNSQVQLMRRIYEGGSYTVIWLGPALEDSQLALSKIEEVANARRDRFFSVLEKDRMAGLVAIIEAVGTNSKCWLTICHLLSRFWWSRAWVFQEAVVSSHAVLLCGFDGVTMNDVMETLVLMSDIAAEQADNSSYVIGSEVVNHAWRLDSAMSLMHLWRAYGETSPDAHYVDLRDAVFLIRKQDATDPKDKIYAALGLVKGISDVTPDYSLEVGEVYRSFARQYIEEHNNLDLLEECSLPADDIVSWAPDYRRKIYGHSFEKYSESDRRIRVYNASRGKPAQFRFSDDSMTLALVGCCSGSIVALGRKWKSINPNEMLEDMRNKQAFTSSRTHRNASLGQALSHWKELLVSYGRSKEPEKQDLSYDSLIQVRYLHADDNLKSAFDKTLCADIKWIPDADPMKLAQHARLSTGEHVSFEPINWQTGELRKEFKFAMKERVFFISDTGYMGLAPEAAKERDIICVVLGGEVPYVIRPKKNGHYLFVGECYVHGLMDGQALEGFQEGNLSNCDDNLSAGGIFGCSEPPVPSYPNGLPPSQAYVHKYMKLNYTDIGHFIDQLSLAITHFGFSDQDSQTLGTNLNSMYNIRCATPITTDLAQGTELISLCQAEYCPLAEPNPDCAAYVNLTANGVSAGSTSTQILTSASTTSTSESTTTTATANSSLTTSTTKTVSSGAIAGISISRVTILVFLIVLIVYCLRRRKSLVQNTPYTPTPLSATGPTSPNTPRWSPMARQWPRWKAPW